jgi:hypothetical protein
MGYPVILGGDHAEFEAEWAASGKPDSERPDWPLPSFDARDWAAAFCKIATNLGYKDAEGNPIDEGWMTSWFANALMRGYDHCSAEDRPLVRALEQIAEGTTDETFPLRAMGRDQMQDLARSALA